MVRDLTGKVALVLEYDGTDYAGWQYQDNADTIQNQVELATEKLFKTRLTVRGSSRTDSGVHARGQIACLELPKPFKADNLAPALNWQLPQDIRIKTVHQVPMDFNPRTWAHGKIYRYFILNRKQPSALNSRFSWHIPKPLDVAAMNQAAIHCIGEHDFASFQAARSEVEDTVRTIRHLFVRRCGDMVTVTCIGNGFLYNMVRIIVGTMVESGLHRQNAQKMAQIIEARSRNAAGPTAPANGLFLERVLYRPSLDTYSRL